MAEDCFGELGLARDLTGSEEELQASYDRRCREAHPDAGGDQGSFQRVQRALAVLRSPGQRLRHWLELEGVVSEPGGDLEEAVVGLFGELGPLVQRAEELAKRLAGARSVLARSLAERESVSLLGDLEAARERTSGQIERLRSRFPDFERRGAKDSRAEAARTARGLLFLEKWERQLRERWAELAG